MGDSESNSPSEQVSMTDSEFNELAGRGNPDPSQVDRQTDELDEPDLRAKLTSSAEFPPESDVSSMGDFSSSPGSKRESLQVTDAVRKKLGANFASLHNAGDFASDHDGESHRESKGSRKDSDASLKSLKLGSVHSDFDSEAELEV